MPASLASEIEAYEHGRIDRPPAEFIFSARSMENMKRAFTLIELLVVIAIIAILVAILMSVFATAKYAAKRAACVSNQKQLGLAWQMYSADNDERACPSYYFSLGAEIAWDFTLRGTESAPGLLGPYVTDGQLVACTVFFGNPWNRPHTGYAYNATYIGGDPPENRFPVSLSAIASPSDTALFADGGYGNPINAQNYLRAPSDPLFIAGKVHFRHVKTAVVVHPDGHVSLAKHKFRFNSSAPDVGALSADDSSYDLE